jgi:DNA-binding transcriptional ArsR family regulator
MSLHQSSQALTQNAFRALADPTRREILMHLSQQDMTIGQVVEKFDVTRGAIKKHLTILEEGALISVEVKGRERINRLQPQGIKAVSDWVNYFSQFWDDRLSRLQAAVQEHEKKKSKSD